VFGGHYTHTYTCARTRTHTEVCGSVTGFCLVVTKGAWFIFIYLSVLPSKMMAELEGMDLHCSPPGVQE
jgi:hypothetical protein